MLECTVEDNCVHNRHTVEMRVRWEKCSNAQLRTTVCTNDWGVAPNDVSLYRKPRPLAWAGRMTAPSVRSAFYWARSEVWSLQLQRDYATWDSRRRRAANPERRVTTANIAKVESSGTALIGVLQNYREDDTVIIGQGGTRQ